MNLDHLDNQQLEQLESRLFEEFSHLDQVIADKQMQLRRIEAMLTHIVTARKARDNEEIGRPLQEVDVDRSVSPPVYVEDRLGPPEDPSTSSSSDIFPIYRSGPFEIKRDDNGDVDVINVNMGRHILVVEKDSETSAIWRIQEKQNISSLLSCLSPQSMDSSPSP